MGNKHIIPDGWPEQVHQLDSTLFRVVIVYHPFKGETRLTFYSTQNGNAVGGIFNGSGKAIGGGIPIVVKRGELYNYMSPVTGRLISDTWWTYASEFDQETKCSIVREGNNYFVIDISGEIISPPAMHLKWAGEGLAIFHSKEDGLQHICRPNGERINNEVDCRVSLPFDRGYSVITRDSDGMKNFMDKNGKIALPKWYTEAFGCHNIGVFSVKDPDTGEVGYIRKGESLMLGGMELGIAREKMALMIDIDKSENPLSLGKYHSRGNYPIQMRYFDKYDYKYDWFRNRPRKGMALSWKDMIEWKDVYASSFMGRHN